MLAPIYDLLFDKHESWLKPSLELTEDQIVTCYETYESDDAAGMKAIIDEKLTPGILINKLSISIKLSVASILQGHQGQPEISHAMVLDNFDKDNDMLIFKNTFDDPESGQPKHFKIGRTDQNAPDELYFVHIEIKDMDGLPSQEEREANKKAEIEKRKQENS